MHPPRTKAFAATPRDEGANVRRQHTAERVIAHLRAFVFPQERDKPRNIVTIGAQRMRACTPLMPERSEPILFQTLGRSSHAHIVRSRAFAK